VTLQCGSPVELKVLARIPAPRALESRLHHHLAAYRVRGEWFEPSPELFETMEYLLARRLPSPG